MCPIKYIYSNLDTITISTMTTTTIEKTLSPILVFLKLLHGGS